MFRVALLSRWHPHGQKPDERYVKDFLSHPDCKVTCVWDPDEKIASEWASEYQVPYSTDLEEILSREDVDGVIATSDPSDHLRIFTLAAKYHKHIFTEKVLAFSLEDALKIQELVKKHDIRFCISFMRLAIPQLVYAKKLLDDGVLGKPVMFRCVCGHNQGVKDMLPSYWYDPEIAHGGAMIDLGFNSAYLARYIMGPFESVSSSFSCHVLNKRVEDIACWNVRFKNGALGSIEATYDSPLLSVFELSLYGTKGSYYARFGGNDVAELRLEGKPSQILDISKLPNELKTPVSTWIDACQSNGSEAPYDVDAALDLVKYMISAYKSAEKNGERQFI